VYSRNTVFIKHHQLKLTISNDKSCMIIAPRAIMIMEKDRNCLSLEGYLKKS